MMNQTIIKIKTIVENNSIDTIIDDVIEPYTSLGIEMNLDKYIAYLKKRIKLALKPMMEWELLYDESTTTSMLYGYFNDTIGNLLTNSFVDKLMMDESWTNQNIGNQEQTSENIQNYQGFDLSNQDGQFSKQSANSKVSGGTTKLQYLQYIQTWTQNYLDNLVRWIKINMCILIY